MLIQSHCFLCISRPHSLLSVYSPSLFGGPGIDCAARENQVDQTVSLQQRSLPLCLCVQENHALNHHKIQIPITIHHTLGVD